MILIIRRIVDLKNVNTISSTKKMSRRCDSDWSAVYRSYFVRSCVLRQVLVTQNILSFYFEYLKQISGFSIFLNHFSIILLNNQLAKVLEDVGFRRLLSARHRLSTAVICHYRSRHRRHYFCYVHAKQAFFLFLSVVTKCVLLTTRLCATKAFEYGVRSQKCWASTGSAIE